VTDSPFSGDVPEIPLAAGPLIKTVAQVRYPRPVDFADESTVAPIQRRLAGKYPVAREGNMSSVIITSEGVSQQPSAGKAWKLEDIAGEWSATVTDQFAALETSQYNSRDEFCSRLDELVEAVADDLRPPIFDRLGIRYINRIEDPSVLADLPNLVRPVALAGYEIPLDGAELAHSLCDTLFRDGDTNIQARWGWLPAGAVIDTTVPPPPVFHWLLDIDVYTTKGGPFDKKYLADLSRDFAERAYRFFRYIMTDDSIKRFAGQE
jgi:uncharacterized protein (TIGR04255 family)